MRSSLVLLTVAALASFATMASAQDAPPPALGGPPPGAAPPPGGPPPGAMPAPMPGPDTYREEGERTANNAVFAELGGPGIIYSINYDRAIGDLAIRGGFMYFSIGASVSGPGGGASSSASLLAIPLTASYLGVGSKKHMLELGAGVTIMSMGGGASIVGVEGSSDSTVSKVLFAPTGIFGYRLQPPDGGFFFRAGLAPQAWIAPDAVVIWPAPYVSLGGTF